MITKKTKINNDIIEEHLRGGERICYVNGEISDNEFYQEIKLRATDDIVDLDIYLLPIKQAEHISVELVIRPDDKDQICTICGKSTKDVDYEYMGSGNNHLKCELEKEM